MIANRVTTAQSQLDLGLNLSTKNTRRRVFKEPVKNPGMGAAVKAKKLVADQSTGHLFWKARRVHGLALRHALEQRCGRRYGSSASAGSCTVDGQQCG